MVGVIESRWFHMMIALFIVANAATIGLETDYPTSPVWPVLEKLFLYGNKIPPAGIDLIKAALTDEPMLPEAVHAAMVEIAAGAYAVPPLKVVQTSLSARGVVLLPLASAELRSRKRLRARGALARLLRGELGHSGV